MNSKALVKSALASVYVFAIGFFSVSMLSRHLVESDFSSVLDYSRFCFAFLAIFCLMISIILFKSLRCKVLFVALILWIFYLSGVAIFKGSFSLDTYNFFCASFLAAMLFCVKDFEFWNWVRNFWISISFICFADVTLATLSLFDGNSRLNIDYTLASFSILYSLIFLRRAHSVGRSSVIRPYLPKFCVLLACLTLALLDSSRKLSILFVGLLTLVFGLRRSFAVGVPVVLIAILGSLLFSKDLSTDRRLAMLALPSAFADSIGQTPAKVFETFDREFDTSTARRLLALMYVGSESLSYPFGKGFIRKDLFNESVTEFTGDSNRYRKDGVLMGGKNIHSIPASIIYYGGFVQSFFIICLFFLCYQRGADSIAWRSFVIFLALMSVTAMSYTAAICLAVYFRSVFRFNS